MGVKEILSGEQPLNWEDAKIIEDRFNKGILDAFEDSIPKWRWDCSFKLDYDGGILAVSSRFYPPHKNDGKTWEGDMTVKVMGKDVAKRTFKADSLLQLKEQVDEHVRNIEAKLLVFKYE